MGYFCRSRRSGFSDFVLCLDHGRRPENSRGTGTDRLTKPTFQIMNANETSPKTNPQMKRIRTMSQIIKVLFLIYVFAAGLIAVLSHTTSHLWRIFGISFSMVSK